MLRCAAEPAVPAAAGSCSCGLRKRGAVAAELGPRRSCRRTTTTGSPGSGSLENRIEPGEDSWSLWAGRSRPGRLYHEYHAFSERKTVQGMFYKTIQLLLTFLKSTIYYLAIIVFKTQL